VYEARPPGRKSSNPEANAARQQMQKRLLDVAQKKPIKEKPRRHKKKSKPVSVLQNEIDTLTKQLEVEQDKDIVIALREKLETAQKLLNSQQNIETESFAQLNAKFITAQTLNIELEKQLEVERQQGADLRIENGDLKMSVMMLQHQNSGLHLEISRLQDEVLMVHMSQSAIGDCTSTFFPSSPNICEFFNQ
jgi:hypothetical protein